MVKSLCVKWAYWKSAKIWKFQNVPNRMIDLYDISLICIKFGAFTIIDAIVPKDCTYPPDHFLLRICKYSMGKLMIEVLKIVKSVNII